MEKSATLNLRVNPIVKQDSEKILHELGLSMSTAVEVFLKQVTMTGGIPFKISLPAAPAHLNADLMSDNELKAHLQKGIDDIKYGRIREAKTALTELRNKYG